MKPRVLFVSRERHTLPLAGGQRRKWDALSARLDLRVLAAARAPQPAVDDRFVLVPAAKPVELDGALFYLRLPDRVAHELRRFDPDVVVAQGVHETSLVLLARRVARSRARVVLDVQGDWKQATRLYGSPRRRLLNPVGDAMAGVALRRADAVRAISPATARLVREEGIEPVAEFPTFIDGTPFLSTPPVPFPTEPRVLFVGALEPIKGVPVLLDAWDRVREHLPGATLRLVGDGSLAGRVAQELTRRDGVEWERTLDQDALVGAMDEATTVCLPSLAEGMGRVLAEAMARGRPPVGSRVGGIPDHVEDGVNGVLVAPSDPEALARGILRVLTSDELETMGAAARKTAERWIVSPEEYAARIESLIRTVLGR